MHNFMLMAVIYRTQDLYHCFSCFLFAESLLLSNLIEKFSPSAQLSYNKKKSCILVELVNFYDIGMIL
jgi:hypothetical protein